MIVPDQFYPNPPIYTGIGSALLSAFALETVLMRLFAYLLPPAAPARFARPGASEAATHGRNSGSPAVNTKGEIAGILEALGKVYHATALVEELTAR